MHRPLTILGLAVVALVAPSRPASSGAEVATTVYVGRHFEVRDHDQPVKYVMNENTRVARITGSLSANTRVQRLRLHTGWNLISLAVTAADFLEQVQFNAGVDLDPIIRTAYRWQPGTGEYISVGLDETVAGGSVLWLEARTNRVIAVRGDSSPVTAPTVPAGGAFVPGPGLEVWPIELPVGVTVWKFDAAEREWRAGLPGDLAPFGNPPGEVAPGQVIYVHSEESVELSIPRPEHQVTYYHLDHLQSAVVTTDSAGDLVEETAYLPFGAARHQFRSAPIETSYGFTHKERDRESGLHYFEARYLGSSLGRFLSFDPLVQRLEALEEAELKNLLAQPAKLNPFAYALNNPIRYNDPDGRDARPRTRPPAAKPEQPKPAEQGPELIIRIGPASPGSKAPNEISALSFLIADKNRTTAGSTGGNRNEEKTELPEFVITRHRDKATTDLFKKMREGTPIKSVILIMPSPKGDFRIEMENVHIDAMTASGSSHDGIPAETLTLQAGSVRYTYPGQPEKRETNREWDFEPRMRQ